MKKIIGEPCKYEYVQHYVSHCGHCHCEFIWTEDEIERHWCDAYVKCPKCGTHISQARLCDENGNNRQLTVRLC